MSSSVTDIDSRLAALQAVAHDWRLKKSTQSSQTNYISILRLLTEEVSLLTRTRDIQTLVSSSVFSRMLAIAVEHAQTGMMSWLVVVGWDNVIQTVLGYVEDKKLFCVYTDQLWKAMLKIVKEGSYAANTPSTHALTSCLYLLRTLFEYAPVEVKVLRRQLPHPVKCVSILAREHSFRLLPFLVHNMAKCTLNADLLEYIKRGFESPEPSVVAAVVRAVEEILFSGTIIETAHRTVLLELLIHYVDRDVSLPDDTLHDAGLVLGCLFEFFQCEVNRYTPEAKAKWNYPAGVNPQQARKVLAPLFMPTIRPNIIKVFSVAFSQLLLRCAVPELMEDAIRSLFVLMLSIPENNRLLMSRIVVNAITEWVGRMPSNAHRIAFLIHIRGYLRGNHKEILPAKTALLCMCKAAPMLFSGREIDFVDDFLQLVEHQPFLMLPVCETIASFTTHSPILFAAYPQRVVGAMFVLRRQRPHRDPTRAHRLCQDGRMF
ncbi:hypothetical protein ADEAN_000259500 [Angomonas deanei]|uniref:Uncharacterized protein n=1 Tax=Angomonas deanei TaxID=59799 RepID=A0A7G2CAT3_9TRYP|nr:hypothetical protein ADEAN_000259500 [Angomonas deanei]